MNTTNKKQDLLTVTGIFDIGRELIDNRSMDEYLEWLVKTIRLFPDTIIFHNDLSGKISSRFTHTIFVEPKDFEAFSWMESVECILKSSREDKDITGILPQYALIQFAKFEMLERVLGKYNCASIMWIDAGISRFMKEIDCVDVLKKNVNYLLKKRYELALEIDVLSNLNKTKLVIRKPALGSHERVISGTAFWVKSNILFSLKKEVYDFVKKELILSKRWDNEQIVLRSVLNQLSFKILYINQMRNKTGSVARILAQRKMSVRYRLEGYLISKILKRDV